MSGMTSLDPAIFRSVLGRFASGVTVLTTLDGAGRDHGMTVSAFCSVSLEPPLVLACVDAAAALHPLLREEGRAFGVSILAEEQEALSRRFAGDDDRFSGVGFTRGPARTALLDDAVAHLECVVHQVHEAGDHAIVVGRVEHVAIRDDAAPLLYYRSGYGRFAR